MSGIVLLAVPVTIVQKLGGSRGEARPSSCFVSLSCAFLLELFLIAALQHFVASQCLSIVVH